AGAFDNLVGVKAVDVLNRVAWAMAIDPKVTPACLLQAEEAIDGALRAMPEMPNVLDTKATIYFRRGRLAEAADLERMAIARNDNKVFASQLDRFLVPRPTPLFLDDDGAALPQITLEPRAPNRPQTIRIELGDRFRNGVAVYAHVRFKDQRVGLFYGLFG